MSNNYDIDGFYEVLFPAIFKIIYCYQWKDPGIIEKYKCAKYKTGFPWRQEYYPDFNTLGLNSYFP